MGLQTPSYNQVLGTILATGTLSSQFDTQGYNLFGLITRTNSILGTLGFMVSDKSDEDSGVYRALVGSNGAAVAIGPVTGQFAISSDVLSVLRGYRFIRVSSTAQTTGLALTLTMKED